MFNKLRRRVINRWLVRPPSIWGKLPNQGDYVRHRCSAAEAQSWQRWVSEVWLRRTTAARVQRSVKPKQQWVELKAPVTKPDLEFVPVSFVLLPRTLDFSPNHFVQGVCVASHDSVGRHCPLIIYQKISSYWMRRMLESQVQKKSRSVGGNSSFSADNKPEADLLFWIARVAARVHAADLSAIVLAALVDQLWQQFEPGWIQLLGGDVKTTNPAPLITLMERHSVADQLLDTANGLRGVSCLPWVNWPQRLLREELPLSAFWQQDVEGGYVNASDNLFSLWRNPL
ncbi:TagF domain-containing protein [Undibacterium sp. RuRC25W]|uniref:TagF domain-containing protein n=1 Tax=Undibacterium sp. RuRC25W TaxID=3413047 RepID=UPI003BF3FB86